MSAGKATQMAVLVLMVAPLCLAQAETPLLLRTPSLSRTHVAFSYAGDIWSVSRDGGEAERLTAGVGIETGPIFSPDGSQVAFTGEYDGNTDVYVVPAAGGLPRRLTWHPTADQAVSWTPDGKRILFRTSRISYTFAVTQLFTIPLEGGFPSEVPLGRAFEGSMSPDSSRIAYVPLVQWQNAWKRYRGGQTKPIWLARLSDSSLEAKIPRDNSHDFNPMWVGDTVYFLSDRNGAVTLFAYDTRSKQVKQVLRNDGLDIKSASAGHGTLVYEQFGSLHLLELGSGKDRRLNVHIAGDLAEVRPRFQKIEPRRIRSAAISPTGARAVVAARGEILTVPAEKGDIRNLTNTTGAVERDPAWSPDGRSIAYLSDESGEYALHIRDQSGLGEVRKTGLGPLVGKRTWGGLVGHYTNPGDLLDGGFTGTPNLAFYADGKWEVENSGVPPDIEVDMDPKAVREGRDPQLEKAVEVVMDLLKKNPPPSVKRPPYPVYR
jgi:tricorn protease